MADIEHVSIVELGVNDAPAGLVLSTEADWNQNEADWRFFLAKGIVFGVRDGERLVATAALLPYSAGAHAAESGAFTLLRFDEPDLADVVYLEHLTGAQYIERPDDTSAYLEAADQIAVDALTPDDTRIALEYLLSRD